MMGAYWIVVIMIVWLVVVILKRKIKNDITWDDDKPDDCERMPFNKSECFCRKCTWHGMDYQLYGIECPCCGSYVVERDEDGYHCPQGKRVSQKRMKELHGYDL